MSFIRAGDLYQIGKLQLQLTIFNLVFTFRGMFNPPFPFSKISITFVSYCPFVQKLILSVEIARLGRQFFFTVYFTRYLDR